MIEQEGKLGLQSNCKVSEKKMQCNSLTNNIDELL